MRHMLSICVLSMVTVLSSLLVAVESQTGGSDLLRAVLVEVTALRKDVATLRSVHHQRLEQDIAAAEGGNVDPAVQVKALQARIQQMQAESAVSHSRMKELQATVANRGTTISELKVIILKQQEQIERLLTLLGEGAADGEAEP